MSNDRITPFLFDGEITIRVIERQGVPWFVATDVCRALGITNARDSVRTLDDDEKDVGNADTPGGEQEMLIVSESEVFVLIFRSRKPNAIRFRKWVTSEVLPALRHTGRYVMPTTGMGLSMIGKPYAEWSLAERRIALSEVNTARHTFNQASAVWMWSHVGLPLPPRHLLPGWWQGELLNQDGSPAH